MFTIPPRRFVLLPLALLVVGCMPPMGAGYMGQGYPYQQPMYAPPGSLNAPGTLVIPPANNAPMYNPANPSGGSYEANPRDTWQAPGSTGTGSGTGTGTGSGSSPSTTFEADDAVPKPKDPGARDPFFNDLNGGNPGTFLTPPALAPGLSSELPPPGLADARPAAGWKTH